MHNIKSHIKFTMFLILVFALLLTSCSNSSIPNSTEVPVLDPTEEISVEPTEVVDQTLFDEYLSGRFMTISEIQGESHNSPLTREYVEKVFGVVTVKRADGFYIQSVTPDDNENTSEGLFVFLNKPPKTDVGDYVFVQGKVAEFYPGGSETGNLSITQIEDAYYEIISKNNPLPVPVILGENGRKPPTEIIDDDNKQTFDMTDGLDFYESLEGMLVEIQNAVAVSPTTAYKEISLLPDYGKNATGLNSRGGLTINGDDFNPERIILDDSLASLPEVKTGEFLGESIIGIVDYTFGNFKVQVLQRVRGDKSGVEPEIAADEPDGVLSVVSYNVENLDARDADKRFETLAQHIVENLKSPGIIALQEVQDNTGPTATEDTSADETYQKIINAVIKIGGPEYKGIDVAPLPNKDGGEPGGNIRVGFLYRTDIGLELAEAPIGGAEDSAEVMDNGHLNFNPGRIDPLNYAFVDSRKPIVAEFLYNGKKLFVINNHWNSKGGDNPLFGSIQPPRLESEIQRNKQAAVVADFIKELTAAEEDAVIIVVGDLNDFYFSKPLEKLKDVGMINLFDTLDINERYTYIYDGNAQVLDNVLVSPAGMALVTEFDVIHINSEFPYRSRFSDHDPVLVRLELK